mgnify:CR=1 FL=1
MKKLGLTIIILTFNFCSTTKGWKNISLTSKDNLHDIEIIDNETALTYSYGTGKLYKTVNAGKSWNQISQLDSVYFEQIRFIDKKVGYICGSPNKLYKTIDGGFTWKDISLKDKSYFLVYGMYFSDRNKGYFSGMYRTQKGMFSEIYKTENGGENWELVHKIKGAISNIKKIGNTIYGIGGSIVKDLDKKNNYKTVYKDTTKQVGFIRDITINKNNNIKAISFNGYLLSKSNSDWNVEQITKNRLRSISYLNDVWLIAGDSIKEPNHVFKSIDNGNSWTPIKTKAPNIHRIKTFKNQIWMVGKNGYVSKK